MQTNDWRDLPAQLDKLAADPDHAALRAREFETLVSLMGFSPHVTVTVAALLRPRELLVIMSDNATEPYDRAARFLDEHGIISPSRIYHENTDPTDPDSIYRLVERQLSAASHTIVDVTGGTKVMTAAAGATAWRLAAPMCYLKSELDERQRPVPGAGKLLIVDSPMQLRIAELRQEALAAYDKGLSATACERFKASSRRSLDPIFDELGLQLSACHAALADLNLDLLSQKVKRLGEFLGSAHVRYRLRQPEEIHRHYAALARVVASDDADGFLAACLALRKLYAGQARYDFAVLLSYRFMEAVIGTHLDRRYGFEMHEPDWSKLGGRDAVKQKLGKKPPYRVGMVDGAILTGRSDSTVGKLIGLANLRNQSVLAHGRRTLSAADESEMRAGADMLATELLDGDARSALARLAEDLRPPSLHEGLFVQEA